MRQQVKDLVSCGFSSFVDVAAATFAEGHLVEVEIVVTELHQFAPRQKDLVDQQSHHRSRKNHARSCAIPQ